MPVPADFRGGLGIYDVSTPAKPSEITNWNDDTASGVHRFDFDGRYAYISPTLDGYVGNIMMILDLKDPAQARRKSAAGGCRGNGQPAARRRPGKAAHRCHHPLRYGQPPLHQLLARRLRHPRHRRHDQAEVRLGPELAPPFPWPTHTCLRCRSRSRPPLHDGRRRGRGARRTTAVAGLPVDRRHHRREHAVAVGSFQVEGIDGKPQPDHDGLPPAVRAGDGHRDSRRVVRARPAHHRHRRTRTRRAKSRTSCPTCRRAPTACRATT